MWPTYLISDPDRPWAVLFVAKDLDEAARSLAAQANGDELHVYASDGGQGRELTTAEREALDTYLAAARGRSTRR